MRDVMTIDDLVYMATAQARERGFENAKCRSEVSEKLMLIVSEVAEALEEMREVPENVHPTDIHARSYRRLHTDLKPEGFGVELADIVIRVAHLAGELNIPLGRLVQEKLSFNATRPYKHSKAM